MINDFTILVFVHLFGDFFIQPTKWAINKDKQFTALLYHCIQYTVPFIVAFALMGISQWWTLWIFATHLAIDNRKFLEWFNRRRGARNVPDWLIVIQDQTLHLLVLAVIVA